MSKISIDSIVSAFDLNPSLGTVVENICRNSRLLAGLKVAQILLAQEIELQEGAKSATLKSETADNINPNHYKGGGFQVIDVIEAYNLNFPLGNALKYICRYKNKNGLEDLKKASWYLDREIKKQSEEAS